MRVRSIAAAAVCLAVVASCSSSDPNDPVGGGSGGPTPSGSAAAETEQAGPASLTVTWLAFNEGSGEGTTGETTLSRTDAADGDFRVEFSANEVDGIGAASQAGAWNASIISTLLLGQPLEGEFRFETSGRVDGPSAGALTTAGLIALARGEEFLDGVTMTGTINATGTIGPVGGIPEKLTGASEAGFDTVLIPLGQRNAPDHEGTPVDVVREGERLGVEVIEVGDIYEAYQHLTGQQLDAPALGTDPRLDNASYDKVAAQVNATLGRYDSALSQFNGLAPEMTSVLAPFTEVAATQAARARDLQQQGLQAGAFNSASNAAALMETLYAGGNLMTPLLTQGLAGVETLVTQALDIAPAETKVFALLDQLSTYTPQTLADVEGLVNAYALAFDAYSLLMFAQQRLTVIQQTYEAGGYTDLELMFTDLVQPMLYAELAEAQVTSTQSLFELGRDNPGAPIDSDVGLAQVGDFFRRGADANFAAFTEAFVTPQAEGMGMSNDALLSALGEVDLNVAAAVTQADIQPAIADYIGEDEPNADYATLGYGLNNFVRNQLLVDKYYNNAVLDEAFNVVDFTWDAVIARATDLGRQHLATEVELLREHETEPVISIGNYEAASLLRAGTPAEQFDAVGFYNGGFVTSRVLAYLGGFQRVDLGGGAAPESAP